MGKHTKTAHIPEEMFFKTPEDAAGANIDTLVIEGLRQNNLKNISLSIPHDKITVVTGLSGSGKSSLVFDTLFAEGRWRFMESLSTYTRLFLERMDRPDLDKITNIRPSVAIEQKNPVRTSRSTVGTSTEINDYLRLLYARIGKLNCVECGNDVASNSPESAAEGLIKAHTGKKAAIGFYFEIKKGAKDAITPLVKKGFVKIRQGSETIDISEEAAPKNLAGNIKVIADRVEVKPENLSRITEAFETAFKEGSNRAWAEAYGADKTYELEFSRELRCVACHAPGDKPSPILFSFNHPLGACPVCKGFGNTLNYDEDKIVPNKERTLSDGAIEPWTKPAYRWWHDELMANAEAYDIDVNKRYSRLSKREKALLFDGTDDFEGINDFFKHLETKKYKLHIRVFISRFKGMNVCTECSGARLKKEALAVTINGKNIAEASSLTIEEAIGFFGSLKLGSAEKKIAAEPLRQVMLKLGFLSSTGLKYITLDRMSRTLSNGEAQRVQLSTQLASSLTGVLYILDEPSIGLHPSDVDMLIETIKKLSGIGNTVVIVEHDMSFVRASDHIVELGPGSGEFGGRLVYSGSREEFLKNPGTLTSLYATGAKRISTPSWRRKGKGGTVELKGARGNNLKGIDLSIPLQTMTCVTGVSGSGKSTLIVDTLYNALAKKLGEKAERPLEFDTLTGAGLVTAVKLIDQEPIGKTPRSNPVTYIGAFDEIRTLFASLKSSAAMDLTAGHFSFNVPGGRCETCGGEGFEKLEMYFLPDVYSSCSACAGKRFKPQVLEIKLAGKNINDVLGMTFDEATRFFKSTPKITDKLAIVRDVGLGYLRLGQPATTLSGGEAQRLKIARELSPGYEGGCLYIMDEPTTGLHPEDVRTLITVLGKLVDTGSTVLIIEHNMELAKTADLIIDLGPGGGANGGEITAIGTPEDVAKSKKSRTARFLAKALAETD
ncbi:MAG: excinuclease ABC subunit UvrA [Deltaproteobacteria bacterium]|nr:excinuclease ABC subunit UvrA [Deltaproteobacteria bacterium]